ncbi:hsp70-like protein [Diaporthe eres]|nr:hsp70-like protein [Diaporthe eres]
MLQSDDTMESSVAKRIVIGVDFGTTFSGVAWAISTSNHPGNVELISRWSNSTGVRTLSHKVPTTLRRLGNGDLQWGFLVPPDAPSNEVLRWFKLKLDDRPSVAEIVPENIRAYNNRRTDQAIVDYLSLLMAEVVQTLTNNLGAELLKDFELKYVITVPAIWSERATQRTKLAFQDAMDLHGSRNITVLSEPEAAAISELQRSKTRIVNEGECFMVLDAGGGTVDLISYVIRQLHPLVVDEAVRGSGDVCGGATVTDRFRAWLMSKIGQLENFEDEVLRDAVDFFDESIKPRVHSALLANNHRFFVKLPGLANNLEAGIRSEYIGVSAFDIVSFFQPSIERIKLLVAEQIAASHVPITAIIMVGGYGQCQYLMEELRQDVLIRERKIQIHQSRRAWTAVVEGAVMKGLHDMSPEDSTRIRISNYKARKHYGTELTVTYQDSVHAELFEKRRWDGLNGCYEVEVMDWFITQGDSFTDSKKFFKDFLVTSKVNHGKPRRIYLIVYSDETSQVAPLSKTETVRELCAVEADLSQIPESQLTKVQGTDGFMYFSTNGQIEIVYKSQTITFTLIYNGQRYNSVTADFL